MKPRTLLLLLNNSKRGVRPKDRSAHPSIHPSIYETSNPVTLLNAHGISLQRWWCFQWRLESQGISTVPKRTIIFTTTCIKHPKNSKISKIQQQQKSKHLVFHNFFISNTLYGTFGHKTNFWVQGELCLIYLWSLDLDPLIHLCMMHKCMINIWGCSHIMSTKIGG